MESLITTILTEIVEIPGSQAILRYVPRFIAYANTLSVPGADKRAIVMRGLHELVQALRQADKITADMQTELDQFIDLTVPVTIDAILDVAAGRVEIKKPATVAEVVPKVNCILGFLQAILRIAGKKAVAKEVQKVAEVVAVGEAAVAPQEVPKEAAAAEAAVEEAPKEVQTAAAAEAV